MPAPSASPVRPVREHTRTTLTLLLGGAPVALGLLVAAMIVGEGLRHHAPPAPAPPASTPPAPPPAIDDPPDQPTGRPTAAPRQADAPHAGPVVAARPALLPAATPTSAAAGEPALAALPQHARVGSGRPTPLVLAGYSAAGTPLRFAIESGPAHGTLGPVEAGPFGLARVRYTPADGYRGPDEFRFVVAAGPRLSAPARVALEVDEPPPPAPAGCPTVRFDERGHFVIDGEPVFLCGFWGLYSRPRGGWQELAGSFNCLVAGSHYAPEVAAAGRPEAPLYLLAQSALDIGQAGIDAAAVRTLARHRGIVAWEVQHEPNRYRPPDPRGDVAAQAAALRAADPCDRPVWVTPSAGAGPLFEACAEHVDFTAVQYFPTPTFALGTLAGVLERARAQTRQPLLYVYRVTGHQPMRYRLLVREPTPAEVRAAVYLAAVHGAAGVALFAYSKGAPDVHRHGVREPNDALYCVADSPEFFTQLGRIAADVEALAPVLLAPRAAVTVAADPPDLACAAYDVNGPLPGGEYLVCVNAADQASPYFEYVSGRQVLRIRAEALAPDGRVFPPPRADDAPGPGLEPPAGPALADRPSPPATPARATTLQPSTLYMQRIHTGVHDRPEPVDRVRLRFVSAPAGVRFRFALYRDEWRDDGPGRRLYLSGWQPVPLEGAAEAALAPPVTLEHTRAHFLLLEVDRAGARIEFEDVRHGARPTAAATELLEVFPPLHAGRPVQADIGFEGATFRAVLARRNLDAETWTAGELRDGRLRDAFAPYAVHIYQLIP